LLGTLVDITLLEADAQRANDAFAAAFAAVAQVHALMSVHDPLSELRALIGNAHLRRVRVHADTACVLRLAQAMHAASGGIFDVAAHTGAGGSSADMHIDADNSVRFERALRLDLGGIAKGHAVDCAIHALRSRGITSALVNAGGDMRCFGATAYPVDLRFAGGVRTVAMLRGSALAASSHAHREVETPQARRAAHVGAPIGAHVGTPIDAHIDARDGRVMRRRDTIVVQAPSAAVADALTKVAMVCSTTADKACRAMQAQWRSFDYFDAQLAA
jgi:FAD:protein FMN transferase